MNHKSKPSSNIDSILLCILGLAVALLPARPKTTHAQISQDAPHTYGGFDTNNYPGDSALPDLRRTFVFSGYWLNAPPGAKTNSWAGKRAVLLKNGFGFLVLFNGRSSNELKPPVDPADLGVRDAELAIAAAQREGFPPGGSTVIYLDIEEGGRMLPSQIDYIGGWSSRVNSKGFVPGVYCSGIKVKESKGQTITTADDIHERAIFVEEDRQRIHIMRVPCVGEVCHKLIRNLGHAWNPAGSGSGPGHDDLLLLGGSGLIGNVGSAGAVRWLPARAARRSPAGHGW